MAVIIDELLEHLANLARIELKPEEKEKLLKDLGGILDHFKELEGLNTENVIPMTGGTSLKNAFRQDEDTQDNKENEVKNITHAFPSSKKGFLKVPPVFGQ